MKDKLETNRQVYEANFKAAKNAFVLNSGIEASACASAFIGDKEPITEEALVAAKKILKRSASMWTTLGGGHARQVVTATLARSEDPENAMAQIKKIHKALDKKFFNSSYLVLAAVIIYNSCEPSEYDRYIERTRDIYTLLRGDHPFITGCEDIANCAIMALTDIDVNTIAHECEKDFTELKERFHGRNKIQYMACMSSLFAGDPSSKAEKTRQTWEMLKEEGVRFDADAFSIVPLIALYVEESDKEKIIRMIKQTSDDLKQVRGLGPMGAGKRIRNLIATALVIDAYKDSAKRPTTVTVTAITGAIITAIITAEITAIVAASAAASSAAASS